MCVCVIILFVEQNFKKQFSVKLHNQEKYSKVTVMSLNAVSGRMSSLILSKPTFFMRTVGAGPASSSSHDKTQ